jgi:hypothetical protein
MKGKGVDLELTANIIRKAFNWQATVIVNYSTNRITAYDSLSKQGSFYVGYGSTIVPLLGKPLYGIYSFPWVGLDPATGDPRSLLNGQVSTDYAGINSKATVADLVYNGPALPPWFGAFRNTFSYKNVELSANITYRLGHYFRRESLSYFQLFNNGNGHNEFDQRWQKPGDENITNVPSMRFPLVGSRDGIYNYSTATVEKAGSIRLQDINVSYTFNRIGSKKFPFKSIQVYAYLRNLGLLWTANNKGIDPDYPNSNPPPKIYSFGLRTNL